MYTLRGTRTKKSAFNYFRFLYNPLFLFFDVKITVCDKRHRGSREPKYLNTLSQAQMSHQYLITSRAKQHGPHRTTTTFGFGPHIGIHGSLSDFFPILNASSRLWDWVMPDLRQRPLNQNHTPHTQNTIL